MQFSLIVVLITATTATTTTTTTTATTTTRLLLLLLQLYDSYFEVVSLSHLLNDRFVDGQVSGLLDVLRSAK